MQARTEEIKETPLHAAARNGDKKKVKRLLRQGANIEAQAKDQFTPAP